MTHTARIPAKAALALASAFIFAGSAAWAADPDEHAAHHPQTPASASNAPPAPSSKAPAAGMEKKMQTMQEMHEKMANARTPEERKALMAEHMKSMRKSMGGMGQMQGDKAMSCDMQARLQGLEKRMDMLQSMVQMMAERLPQAAAH